MVTVLAGSVGLPAASALFKFLDDFDLPDPKDLLNNKVSYTVKGERLDRTFTVLNSCVAAISTEKEQKTKEAWATRMWDLLGEVIGEGSKEIAAGPAKELTLLDLYASPNANKPLLALSKMAQRVTGKST